MFFTFSENVRGHRCTFNSEAAVMSRESPSFAEITLFLSLDRLEGKANANCLTELHRKTQTLPQDFRSTPNLFDQALNHVRQPTEAELRAALELEMWRERQEELFRVQLKQKEEIHLSTLAQEWKERDSEREILLQTRLKECYVLEDKLRRALSDIDNRELKVRRKEDLLAKRETELKSKIEENEKKIKTQQFQKKSILDRNHDEAERTLRSRIESLEQALQEKEMEKNKALESKQRYKKMWGKQFQELIAIKNNISFPSPEPQIRVPLNGFSTQPILSEHQSLLEKEKAELRQIQKEVQELKHFSQNKSESMRSVENNEAGTSRGTDYLQQLTDERELLLRTGSYSTNHRVILELDRHIRIARNCSL